MLDNAFKSLFQSVLNFKILGRFFLAGVALFFLAWSVLVKKNSPTFSGTVEVEEYYLGTPVAGRIKEIYVSEGDKVEKGQRVAVMEHFDQAQRDFQRAQGLFEASVVSEQELEQASLRFQDQQILSPVKGVVLQKLYDQAEVAPAGGRILIVADTQKYWVKIYMPQSFINRIEMGREAQIKLEGVEDTMKGTIGYISPFVEFTPRAVQTSMERASQTFAVKVYFETLLKTLRPGITADVIFEGL